MQNNRVSLGMVVALEYHDPLFDPARCISEIQNASPTLRKFSKAASSSVYGRKDGFPTAAGIRCQKVFIDGGPESSATPPAC